MEILRCRAYARAGLIGNPSDGYNGKTIAIIVKNYWAQVVLYEWDRLEILPSRNDESIFSSIDDLVHDVRLHGYYGGIRLVKAAIKGFAEYCSRQKLSLHHRNFSVRYETNIPKQVGMAGSSAIVLATIRALMAFYNVEIPSRILPSLVLSVEKDQLGISAGLQDRVAQVYEGCVYMDFSKEAMNDEAGFLCGRYEPIPTSLLPPLYVSFSPDFGEPTEILHNDLRFRYNQNEPAVVNAMQKFADLTVQVRQALLDGKPGRLGSLMDQNFDLRRSICRLLKEHVLMIETARSCGASAKFAGSGGAIIGTYPNEDTFLRLQSEMAKIGCITFKPVID